MQERRFIFYTQEGNVSRLPGDFNRRSRALTVYREPKVPAPFPIHPLLAVGVVALAVILMRPKDSTH